MEFSIATILSLLSPDKLVSGKQIEKKLGCEDEKDIEKLQIALDVLERIGVLTKEFGKYRRCIEKDVVEAKLRCSSKGFCFAIQDDEDADDIYIRETHLSNAWNGDRVLVKIIKEGTRRRSPEGEVKVILERANPSVLARVVQDENGDYMAVPLDDRLLFEIKLKENGIPLAETVDHLVHVGILRYPIGQKPPIGKVLRVLGSDAAAAADIDIVSSKHDLPHEFPEKVLAQASSLSCEIPPQEWEKRIDLRELLTITIEPDVMTEQDLFRETALSLEKAEDNRWILGVHIADVAHFVPEDTPLDREARKRGTAVHLGHKIIPLFPKQVQECASLIPNQERLAISVLVTLDDNGEVLGYHIKPSIVRVDHQLTYKQVQTMISTNSAKPGLESTLELLNHLLFEISPTVKARRLQKGGFDILLDDVTSYFKDEGRIGAIASYPSLPILSLLTELMVLVGRLVAEHFQHLQIPAIYCSQGKPDWDELEDLLKLVANLGLKFQLESEDEIYPMDYYRLTQAFSNSEQEKILQHEKILHHLLLNSLKSNKYTLHPAPHFGLALDSYTHCLSPGQRYVDLVNQRILKKVFEQGRDRRTTRVKEGVDLTSSSCHGQIHWKVLPPETESELEADLHSIISHLNEREKIAEDAERDLAGLKKAEKMKDCTGKVFRGLITGVQSYGFFVQIIEEELHREKPLLVEGLVHVSSLKDDWYEYLPKYSCLVGRRNRLVYRLGDEVEVEVKSVDYYRQQIDLVVVRGGTVVSEDHFEE
ncbi:MAG: ribonuclease R [Geminocystis sp.]|nr:ribonuclease R [Geminocystis sp.]MCX8078698.1 ribonuclease R [Geminocystis sp.]MDW8117040.1 ribonuclease R [Geminocystis sp.]HIK38779.1 VacB/RNase II family 3'-5' exoribonuclease [Geminocystis sp. M7585_C2015_104]